MRLNYNERMLALRFSAVLALVFWIGGLLALGAIAAPATFDVLGARSEDGRALAGAVFGQTLRRFQTGAYLCGAVLLVSLAARAVLGPRPMRFGLRMGITAAMVSSAAWTGLVMIPQIEEAQRTRLSAPAAPPDDPRRAQFARLHGLATSLQLVPVLGGLALLLFELKD